MKFVKMERVKNSFNSNSFMRRSLSQKKCKKNESQSLDKCYTAEILGVHQVLIMRRS